MLGRRPVGAVSGWKLVVVMVAAVSVLLSGCGGSSAGHGDGSRGASGTKKTEDRDDAAAFLSRYVTPDGRVIRHDQGGDIVSEGQAYGMLIAESAGRPEVARTIWRWTSAHLRRPDGLLSFHASGSGAVQDQNSATDADALAAYALLRYTGPEQARLRADGSSLAQAVLTHEAVDVDGAPVLVAGNWAKGPPITVDPSYWMPGVFSAVAQLTGDGRWAQAARTAVTLVDQLTGSGHTLPPDWAQLQGGRLVPTGAPDGSAGVRYGLDAARVPLWFAYSCDGSARSLAAAWWRAILSQDDRAASVALGLNGEPMDSSPHAVPLLAAAAAASAADDANRSSQLRQRAAAQAQAGPTYYGDAWLALDQAFQHRRLDPCRDGR